jgi:hypothetical protein
MDETPLKRVTGVLEEWSNGQIGVVTTLQYSRIHLSRH